MYEGHPKCLSCLQPMQHEDGQQVALTEHLLSNDACRRWYVGEELVARISRCQVSPTSQRVVLCSGTFVQGTFNIRKHNCAISFGAGKDWGRDHKREGFMITGFSTSSRTAVEIALCNLSAEAEAYRTGLVYQKLDQLHRLFSRPVFDGSFLKPPEAVPVLQPAPVEQLDDLAERVRKQNEKAAAYVAVPAPKPTPVPTPKPVEPVVNVVVPPTLTPKPVEPSVIALGCTEAQSITPLPVNLHGQLQKLCRCFFCAPKQPELCVNVGEATFHHYVQHTDCFAAAHQRAQVYRLDKQVFGIPDSFCCLPETLYKGVDPAGRSGAWVLRSDNRRPYFIPWPEDSVEEMIHRVYDCAAYVIEEGVALRKMRERGNAKKAKDKAENKVVV